MVAKYHAAGFQQMKIYDGSGRGTLRAIAEEAHRPGMTVTGPRASRDDGMQAVEAGMDQINHSGSRCSQAVKKDGDSAIQFFREHGPWWIRRWPGLNFWGSR